MKHGLDVIVIGYHQPQDCREFADSYKACTDTVARNAYYYAVEVTFEDYDAAYEGFDPERIITDTDNCGHARACNNSARWIKEHDTLFFCNADTRLYPGVMDRLFDTLWSDPSYGCVGPRQVDVQGRITAAGIFGTQAAPAHRGWLQRTDQYQDLRTDAVMASGSLYMVKRHVWEELAACQTYVLAETALTGALPTGAMPAVKHYYSETWPSYHMAAHGYLNVYEGRVTARHDWHQASPQGGWGEKHLPADREHFRRLCDYHGIPHD